MSWGDEGEVAAARERGRRGARNVLWGILGAFGLLAVSGTAIAVALRHGEASRGAKMAAVAASVSAEQARWNADHLPKPDAAAVVDVPAVVEAPPNTDYDAPGRALLAKIAANPRAVAPRDVTAPDTDHPWTSYEYDAPGLGDVVLNRWTATKWEIVVAQRQRPEVFAPIEALKPLDRVTSNIRWWKIDEGTFRGDFVQVRPAGMSLFSRAQICGHEPDAKSLTPKIDRDCGY